MSSITMHAPMNGQELIWDGTKITAIKEMSMPSNVRLPGIDSRISVTKLGVERVGEFEITTKSLLRFGGKYMAPTLFLMHSGVQMRPTCLGFEPANVLCMGSLIHVEGERLDPAPQFAIVRLSDADMVANVLKQTSAVQLAVANGKSKFKELWDAMTVAFEDHVNFTNLPLFTAAFEKGEAWMMDKKKDTEPSE